MADAHTPAASITPANGCVVRVGDSLPCVGGKTIVLLDIEDDPDDVFPLLAIEIAPKPARNTDTRWYSVDAIDLAKLAEQQAAQPAGTTVREMVERWQRRMRAIQRTIDAGAYDENGKQVMDARVSTIHECAAELSAALPGGMTEGQPMVPLASALRKLIPDLADQIQRARDRLEPHQIEALREFEAFLKRE